MPRASRTLSEPVLELIRHHITHLEDTGQQQDAEALMSLVVAYDLRGIKIQKLQHHVDMLVSRHPL